MFAGHVDNDSNDSECDNNDNDSITPSQVHPRPLKKSEKNFTPITCIAVDPGIVHHAIIRMSISGFEYKFDPRSHARIKIPIFEVEYWEHWSLKHKITYRADKDWKLKTNKYEGDNESTEDKIRWHENLANFVASADWIFEKGADGKLVPLVTEVQCGYIKNEEIDAYTISHILPAIIKCNDITRGLGGDRLIVNSAKKYGIPSDGSLSYTERKRMSDDVTYNLLKETGKKRETNYLNLTLLAMKRDSIPRVKTDDMSDAFTLGLEYLARQWELREYNEDNSIQLEDNPVRVVIFDEEEDEKLLTQKQRVRRKPKKQTKNNNNNNNNNNNDDDDDNIKTTQRKTNNNKKKNNNTRKKKNMTDEDESRDEFDGFIVADGEMESDEIVVEPERKSKKRKQQLQDDNTGVDKESSGGWKKKKSDK